MAPPFELLSCAERERPPFGIHRPPRAAARTLQHEKRLGQEPNNHFYGHRTIGSRQRGNKSERGGEPEMREREENH